MCITNHNKDAKSVFLNLGVETHLFASSECVAQYFFSSFLTKMYLF